MTSNKKILVESVNYITGNQKAVKVKGPKRVIKAFKNCLTESRKLYILLNETKNVSLTQIEQQVQAKRKAAQEFKNLTGDVWPF